MALPQPSRSSLVPCPDHLILIPEQSKNLEGRQRGLELGGVEFRVVEPLLDRSCLDPSVTLKQFGREVDRQFGMFVADDSHICRLIWTGSEPPRVCGPVQGEQRQGS